MRSKTRPAVIFANGPEREHIKLEERAPAASGESDAYYFLDEQDERQPRLLRLERKQHAGSSRAGAVAASLKQLAREKQREMMGLGGAENKSLGSTRRLRKANLPAQAHLAIEREIEAEVKLLKARLRHTISELGRCRHLLRLNGIHPAKAAAWLAACE